MMFTAFIAEGFQHGHGGGNRCWATVLALALVLVAAPLAESAFIGPVITPPPITYPPTPNGEGGPANPNSGAPTGGIDQTGGSVNFGTNPVSNVTFSSALTPQPTYTIPKQPTFGLEVDNMAFTTTTSVMFSFNRQFTLGTPAPPVGIGVTGSEDVTITGTGKVTETITEYIFPSSSFPNGLPALPTSADILLAKGSVSATATASQSGHVSWNAGTTFTLQPGTYYAEYIRSVNVPTGVTFEDPNPYDMGRVAPVPEPATIILFGIGAFFCLPIIGDNGNERLENAEGLGHDCFHWIFRFYELAD